MTTELFFCVMCPRGLILGTTIDLGLPWVGDYDPGALHGECPRCGSGVGIFGVETDGFPYDAETRGQIAAVVKAGAVDRLAAVPA